MTGQLKLAVGSAASPSLTFTGDLNTGIYRKAADSLGFATAGSERAYFDSSGKLFALGDADVAGNFSVTGTLAITGASTLGTATVTTLNIGNADTSLTRTGAGDIAVEGNTVYRAGGTNVAIADGGTNADTAAAAFANLKQAASDSATGVIEIAVQSEMEARSSTTLAVTPGRQHFHPGHPKAGGLLDGTGTPSLDADYGLGAITDNGTGDYTIGFDTAFSGANFWAATGAVSLGGAQNSCISIANKTTTSVDILTKNSTNASSHDVDGTGLSFWGDYA